MVFSAQNYDDLKAVLADLGVAKVFYLNATGVTLAYAYLTNLEHVVQMVLGTDTPPDYATDFPTSQALSVSIDVTGSVHQIGNALDFAHIASVLPSVKVMFAISDEGIEAYAVSPDRYFALEYEQAEGYPDADTFKGYFSAPVVPIQLTQHIEAEYAD